jgi:hypothetical protein
MPREQFCLSLEGKIVNQEMQKIYDELKRLAGELVAFAGVMDLSEVTTFAVDSSTIRWLAEKPPSYRSGSEALIS